MQLNRKLATAAVLGAVAVPLAVPSGASAFDFSRVKCGVPLVSAAYDDCDGPMESKAQDTLQGCARGMLESPSPTSVSKATGCAKGAHKYGGGK